MKLLSNIINVRVNKDMLENREDNREAIIEFLLNNGIDILIDTEIKASYYEKDLYTFTLKDLNEENFNYWFEKIEQLN